jgi:ferric enterobactin receptor
MLRSYSAKVLKARVILIYVLCGLLSSALSAQKAFEFNRPGNACNFYYVVFAPNNDYVTVKRSCIFVVGKPGETAMQTYESDSLKHLPEFYRYKFVYVPNKGGSAQDKLYCLDALVNLSTGQYAGGRENVFLYIDDLTVQPADLEANRMRAVFRSVRIARPHGSVADTIAIADDFKERIPDLENKQQTEFGTYYQDETIVDENEDASGTIPQKTYFGPPQAYDFTLSGMVRDQSTGEALPYAMIRIRGNSAGVVTNPDGYFTLAKVPTDTSVLIVSYVGYAATEVYLNPALPQKNMIIEIRPSAVTLKDVKIVDTREEVVLVKKEDVSVMKMTPRQLEKLPSLGEKDVMRSFQLMPGVSASQESSSGLYVRGGTPDQNLVLYDGFTVYHVDHLYGFFSAFNANALKDVQLYKGGFASRFGGRLSSVTEITGKDGNQKKFNIGGDLSLLSLNAYVEIPIGEKFSSIIAYRRSYRGPIYNKLFEKFNESNATTVTSTQPGPPGGGPAGGGRFAQQTTVSNYFYDLNGKFTYRPNQKDILSLSIFNGTDKLDNSNSFNAPSFGSSSSNFSISSVDLTKYGNIGTSFRWARKWTDNFYGNTILSYSNYYSNRNRSVERTTTNSSGEETTNGNGIFEHNDLRDYSIKSEYQWDMFSFSQLQFGGFGTYFDIAYTYAQNDTTTVLDKQNQAFLGGGFVQNKFRLFDGKLILLPGVRASYFETTHQPYFEPRASLSFSVTKNLTLKGATGKYYQFANRVTREDILSGSKDFWLLSDGKSVPVSASVHYILGLSYETTGFLFSAEAYYKEVSNLTEYSLRINPNPFGVDYDENFFTGYGFARGIEFLAQKKIGNFSGWASYSLGEAKNHFDVYADTWFAANQDVRHEFKLVAMYQYKRWDFAATWIFATGRPYTAPSGGYSVELLDGTTQDYFTVTSKNGLRLPNYHRADISANYKLLAGEHGEKRRREIGYIGFSVFNLYNRTNVWYKTYTIESGSLIETNVNYTGITPNVTLSLKIR